MRAWLWRVGLVLAAASVSPTAVATNDLAPALGTRARCAHYAGVPASFARDPRAGMIWIEAGDFTPGTDHGYPEERGASGIHVDGFWIDRTEVTNAQFARFVEATGYVTQAERAGIAPVFRAPETEEPYAWWRAVSGASWRHPAGPASSIEHKPNHPVVQVTYADALAYANWLGHTLPTESQWEYAASARQDAIALEREPRDARGRPLANFWQGEFPQHNTLQDGFETTAPVGCFAANPFGLYDTLGNVWEWTGSRYTSSHRSQDADQDAEAEGGEHCSSAAHAGARFTLKGGSFLCSANFCARYRVAARHAQEVDQPAMHVGFRTVRPTR